MKRWPRAVRFQVAGKTPSGLGRGPGFKESLLEKMPSDRGDFCVKKGGCASTFQLEEKIGGNKEPVISRGPKPTRMVAMAGESNESWKAQCPVLEGPFLWATLENLVFIL